MVVELGLGHVRLGRKAWRSRDVAIDFAKGSAGASYKMLPSYLQRLVISNPGTVMALETSYCEGVGQWFRFLFIAIGAFVSGYKYMRKVIVIDRTHLKGKYGGCLLTASAQDGNYQIFPLTFDVVDSENDIAWEWFFRKLVDVVPDADDIVFISDRHGSIYSAIRKVYRKAGHCAYVVHLQRNIQTIFKKKHLSYLVGRAARAYSMPEFYSYFNEIKHVDIGCAEYLLDIGFKHWMRLHFPGKHYNLMTSNLAESLNVILSEARVFPIIPLIEYIYSTLMSWFARRHDASTSVTSSLPPKVQEIVTKNFERSTGFDVLRVSPNEFDVRSKDGGSNLVDLVHKTCRCYEFQLLEIPCTHAVGATVRASVHIDTLVSKELSSEFWKLAYNTSVYPVTGLVSSLPVNDGLSEINSLPPATKRPPDRPHKQRLLSRG